MLLQSSLQIINFGYYYFYRILLCVMSYLLLINTVRWRWFDLPAMVRTRWSCSFNFLPIFWKKIVSPYCFNLHFPTTSETGYRLKCLLYASIFSSVNTCLCPLSIISPYWVLCTCLFFFLVSLKSLNTQKYRE